MNLWKKLIKILFKSFTFVHENVKNKCIWKNIFYFDSKLKYASGSKDNWKITQISKLRFIPHSLK